MSLQNLFYKIYLKYYHLGNLIKNNVDLENIKLNKKIIIIFITIFINVVGIIFNYKFCGIEKYKGRVAIL